MSARGRQAFVEAGGEILVEAGAAGLTVAALCGRLHVTKGSFYHHFEGIPDLVSALVEDWETHFATRFAAANTETDPMRRLECMALHAIEMCDPLAAAVRAWGYSNPAARQASRRVEAAAYRNVRSALEGVLGDPTRAELLAQMGIALMAGMQQFEPPLERARFAEICIEWTRSSIGLDIETTMGPDGLELRFARREPDKSSLGERTAG